MLKHDSPAPKASRIVLKHDSPAPKASHIVPKASHTMPKHGLPTPQAPTIPHSVARLAIAESGYVDFASLCATARVSRDFKRLANFESAIGRTLDLSKYGDAVTDRSFGTLFRTRVRFKGRRRVRNVSVQSCTRLSTETLSEFVANFNTNPLFLTAEANSDLSALNDKLDPELGTEGRIGQESSQQRALLPRYTSSAYGNGMRIFVWQAGGKKDWDIQRVLYRCCDMWCSVRANKLRSVQIELFLWIRSEDVLRSVTPRELAFALQALRDHPDYDELHSSLLKVCRTHKSPRNIIPEKIRQLEDSAIYIGTICPGNCCLQVMAKQRPPGKATSDAGVRRSSASAVTASDASHDRGGLSETRRGRSISAPNSRYVWRT